jgi:uncharacterized protein YoxC
MNQFLLGIITCGIVVLVVVLVMVLVELKTCIGALRELVKTTEDSLKPTANEVQQTLKSLRNATDNVTAVAEDLRTISGSIRVIGENVKNLSQCITSSTALEVSGLKAGLEVGLGVLLRNLFRKG